jgi:hypothetical protein
MPRAYSWRYRYLDTVERGIQHLTPARFIQIELALSRREHLAELLKTATWPRAPQEI